MGELVLSFVMLAIGIVGLARPRKVGIAFCRLGKATWRLGTFGLTDMRFFYPENQAQRIGRGIGAFGVFIGISFGAFATLSLHGPGMFAAIRQSRIYLEKTYGPSDGNWSLSANIGAWGDTDYVVEYRFADHHGNLNAHWTGKEYVISEIVSPADKNIAQPRESGANAGHIPPPGPSP